jgi:hypothetical protein
MLPGCSRYVCNVKYESSCHIDHELNGFLSFCSKVSRMIDRPEPATTHDVNEKKEWEDLSSRLNNQVGLLRNAEPRDGN